MDSNTSVSSKLFCDGCARLMDDHHPDCPFMKKHPSPVASPTKDAEGEGQTHLKNESAIPEQTAMGECMEKGCKENATKDYNGHQHFVCDYHYDKLNDEFDEEYK